ncbi:hypothetical protein RCO28_03945 [Streptomyces sp. LHD-70]|uniref:hypothetical protein n=1 Tax=Streptomyces sp. LHD-70 TaxID=3072140 RepID=UPI00280E3879|nr:hypothetical protein [Streptomyces sp. LHD-70]MDQ8701645.1 hypothetical protein [Streptomyces sp. LHD-70]
MRVLTLTTLASLARPPHDVPLELPEGMTTPLGCDAVGMPEEFGRQVRARLPRIGCVYADGARWWWIVPSGSSVSLDWPLPLRYAAGARVPAGPSALRLVHRPEGTAPYTPPIPLYLAVCRITGTVPLWMRTARTAPASPTARR